MLDLKLYSKKVKIKKIDFDDDGPTIMSLPQSSLHWQILHEMETVISDKTAALAEERRSTRYRMQSPFRKIF